MGIFNQQPNYNQSITKRNRGITGPQGPPGPPGPAGASGTGFNFTADGNYDMVNKKLANMAKGTTLEHNSKRIRQLDPLRRF